jgi:RHS repeat-associated protein
VKTKYANVNMVSQNQRYLCGVEENRLGAVRDPEHLAAYLYNAGGARVWKFTGDVSQMGQSGKTVIEQVSLNNKTLYASSFFVASDHGYTKHYFAGSERVCSKLGGGLHLAPVIPTEATVEAIFEDYEQMRNRLFDLINKFANCNPHPEQQTVTYIDIEPYLGGIQDYLDRHEPEENRFFYHPDHLGSSNFITDATGDGYQHLQYLPFGETAVSQKVSWWSTPYQFTGKEKDDETGYNYFGARYYSSDISVWLSVDPLIKPFESPYAYCFNNPVRFIDPKGLNPTPPKETKRYIKLRDNYIADGSQKNAERYVNYINRNSNKIGRSNAVYNSANNCVQFDVSNSFEREGTLYSLKDGVTTMPQVTIRTGCVTGGVKDPSMVPPSGPKYYSRSGSLFLNTDQKGIPNSVRVLNGNFSDDKYTLLNLRAQQTGDYSTRNKYMELSSEEYMLFNPKKTDKYALVYNNMSGGETVLMFLTLMGEGFASGYRCGQTTNIGLQEHYEESNHYGARKYWIDRNQAEKFEPWW